MLYIISILIILLPITFFSKFLPNEILSKENTLSLKGIFAVIVMLHHISQIDTNYVILNKFNNMGMYSVSIFFFISFYGMVKQLKITNRKYLDNFLPKRFLVVIIPVIIVSIVYILIGIIFYKNSYDFISIIKIYAKGSALIKNGCYLNIILVFYLVFYFIYKYIKNIISASFVFSIFIILTILFIKNMEFGIWWYNSLFAVIFGVVVALFEEKILVIIKNVKINYSLMFISTVLFYLLNNKEDRIIRISSEYGFNLSYWIVQNFLCINFVIMVLLIVSKFKLNYKILKFLGKISFEMYMIHGAVMWILNKYEVVNMYKYTLYVIIITMFLSYIFNKLFQKINMIILRNIRR